VLVVQPEHFGKTGELTVTKDDTLFLNGGGAPEVVEARAEAIRDQVGLPLGMAPDLAYLAVLG
jgi:hypothetical protein